jgi:hypothetical protein
METIRNLVLAAIVSLPLGWGSIGGEIREAPNIRPDRSPTNVLVTDIREEKLDVKSL